MNLSVKTPAAVNTTVSAPFGASARKLTIFIPAALATILDTDIVTSHIHFTIGATRMIHGAKTGYAETKHCPSSGRARIHGDFAFARGAKASADTKVAC